VPGYNSALTPPIPFTRIRIAPPTSWVQSRSPSQSRLASDWEQGIVVPMVLDTGSSRSVIPRRYLQQLTLETDYQPIYGSTEVSSAFGVVEVALVEIDLLLDDFDCTLLTDQEVIVIGRVLKGEVFGLFGRDLLQQFRVILDWPGKLWHWDG
jgi:hypothetical protein